MKTLIQFNFNSQDTFLVKTETVDNRKYEPCKKELVEMIRLLSNSDESVSIEDVILCPKDTKGSHGQLTAKIIYPNKNEDVFDAAYTAKLITIFD